MGDAVLQVIISNLLFNQYPDANEGQLSRLRSRLVRGTTLSKIAISLDLGEYLILGSGEKKTGGNRRASILADALEAIFGAIYLDSDFHTVQEIIKNIYTDFTEPLTADLDLRDPKTQLQEYLQGKSIDLPIYDLVETSGLPHSLSFEVNCFIDSLELKSSGKGNSRRAAEQNAAAEILILLGI